MIDQYDPEDPKQLTSWLGTYVNAYWNDFLDYWELQNADNSQYTPEERAHHAQLNEIAQAIKALLHTLAPDENVTRLIHQMFGDLADHDAGRNPHVIAAIARALHASHIVRDSIAIDLAFDATDRMLPIAEKRVPDLVALFSGRRISARAAAYLDRVTRLYLWGFDPECVMMCRSVLESALASRLYPGLDPDARAPNISKLITEAAHRALLPEMKGNEPALKSPLWNARRIRDAANDIVHAVPVLGSSERGQIADARTALVDLCDVLNTLFPREV